MNRKLEIIIGIIILLVLVSFIGFNIFKSNFDEDMVMSKISKAIEDNDIEYLKDYIEVEGRVEPLKSTEIEKIIDVLKKNINIYDLKDLYGSRKNTIYLKQEGKEKLIFDKYILVLKPYDLTINSNIDGVAVYIDDEKIGDFEKESYEYTHSNLLPGSHIVKLVHGGEYGDLQVEEEVILFNKSENIEYIDLRLEGEYFDIYSNREEATLYINGKDTKINLKDGYTIGPIAYDSSIDIMAKARIEGDIYSSEEYSIDGSNSYYELYIDYLEPVKEEIVEAVQEDINRFGKIGSLLEGYQRGLMEAINNNYYGYVEAFIEDGSPLMKSQMSLVENLNSKGTTEELINYVIHDIVQISDTIFEAKVTENHKIFYSSGKTEELSNTWIYTIINSGNKFYLRNLRK